MGGVAVVFAATVFEPPDATAWGLLAPLADVVGALLVPLEKPEDGSWTEGVDCAGVMAEVAFWAAWGTGSGDGPLGVGATAGAGCGDGSGAPA